MQAAAGWWAYESGAYKSVTVPYVYESGAYKAITQGWVWESGAWKLFFSSLSVSANNISSIVSSNVGACTSAESSTPGAVVTGGSGSFTYAWTYVSGSTGMALDTGPTILNPKWFASPQLCAASGSDAAIDAVWKIVVTDTVTTATANTSITVHLEYNRP